MGNFGFPEMLVVAVLALLVFGPRRLPEIARNAGRALREFKRVTHELSDELKAGLDEPPAHPPGPPLPPASGFDGEGPSGTEILPLPPSVQPSSTEGPQEPPPAATQAG